MTVLAEMFKERDPKAQQTMTTGFVLSSPPNPRIKLNDGNVLYKENLVFASSLLDGYSRRMKFLDNDWGLTTTVSDGGQGASAHNHLVNLANKDTPIKWTDTLVKDDEVILMPVSRNLYFVLDKAVRF